MAADPMKSAGARAERKAVLAYVRRVKNSAAKAGISNATAESIEAWLLGRQARYDKRPGGLGKK